MPIDPNNMTTQHLSNDPDKMILSHKRVKSLIDKIRDLRDENNETYSLPELVNAVGMLAYYFGCEDGEDGD